MFFFPLKKTFFFFSSANGNDTWRTRVVRWRGQYDKSDVCHTLQLGATGFYILVLQRRGDELRQSQGWCVRDHGKGQWCHDLVAPHTGSPAQRLWRIQVQAKQRQRLLNQGTRAHRYNRNTIALYTRIVTERKNIVCVCIVCCKYMKYNIGVWQRSLTNYINTYSCM